MDEYIIYCRDFHCRDCAKWHFIYERDGTEFGICTLFTRSDAICGAVKMAEDYCYYGERREEGDE